MAKKSTAELERDLQAWSADVRERLSDGSTSQCWLEITDADGERDMSLVRVPRNFSFRFVTYRLEMDLRG
jgi:hypothetical protein